MIVTSKISVDLSRPNIGVRVNAIQGDGNTRCVAAALLSGGLPWEPPDGVEIAVAYHKPDGTRGLYNKLPDGTPAATVSGNVVTIILAPQMLTASGTVRAGIVINNARLDQLTTFPFEVSVAGNQFAGAQQSEDYIRLQWLEDKLGAYVDGLNGTIGELVDEYLKEHPPLVGGEFLKTDKTLSIKDGVLGVNTTYAAEQDNTLPITSAGVHTIVGNIGAILDTI